MYRLNTVPNKELDKLILKHVENQKAKTSRDTLQRKRKRTMWGLAMLDTVSFFFPPNESPFNSYIALRGIKNFQRKTVIAKNWKQSICPTTEWLNKLIRPYYRI